MLVLVLVLVLVLELKLELELELDSSQRGRPGVFFRLRGTGAIHLSFRFDISIISRKHRQWLEFCVCEVYSKLRQFSSLRGNLSFDKFRLQF